MPKKAGSCRISTARYKPAYKAIQTGVCKNMGKQPNMCSGLTPFSRNRRACSCCKRFGSPAYRFCNASISGLTLAMRRLNRCMLIWERRTIGCSNRRTVTTKNTIATAQSPTTPCSAPRYESSKLANHWNVQKVQNPPMEYTTSRSN